MKIWAISPDARNGAWRGSSRQAERQDRTIAVRKPASAGRDDPERAPVAPLPGPPSVERPARGGVLVAGRRRAGRPERPPDDDDRDDRDEDPELRLDERRDDREDRRALGPVAPQLAQGEQQEHDAERVDLAPDDAVEPGDRVEDDERRAEPRRALAAAELADHRPDELAEGEVGEDRRDLDQVADAAERGCPTPPDEPQDVQVAGRVVVEEVPVVEAVQARSSARLSAQNRKTRGRPRSRSPGRRYAMMSRRASPSARRTRMPPAASRDPGRRDGAALPASGSPVAGPVNGIGLQTSDEVDGSVAEGRPGRPPARLFDWRRPTSRWRRRHRRWRWSRSSRSPPTGSPAATASTTTSSGRRWRSSTAGRRSTGRSSTGRFARQRVLAGRLPRRELTASPRGAAAVPAAARDRAPAVRRDLGPRDRHPGRLRGPRRDRRRARLVGARPAAGLAPRSASRRRLLRLRDGLLVRRPARHDLVLRPRRRGRVDAARGRARARGADPAARTTRSTSRRAPDRGARSLADAAARGRSR